MQMDRITAKAANDEALLLYHAKYSGEAMCTAAWLLMRFRRACGCRICYKLPSAVEFCAALPRSLVGKVLRRVLVEGEREAERD